MKKLIVIMAALTWASCNHPEQYGGGLWFGGYGEDLIVGSDLIISGTLGQRYMAGRTCTSLDSAVACRYTTVEGDTMLLRAERVSGSGCQGRRYCTRFQLLAKSEWVKFTGGLK